MFKIKNYHDIAYYFSVPNTEHDSTCFLNFSKKSTSEKKKIVDVAEQVLYSILDLTNRLEIFIKKREQLAKASKIDNEKLNTFYIKFAARIEKLDSLHAKYAATLAQLGELLLNKECTDSLACDEITPILILLFSLKRTKINLKKLKKNIISYNNYQLFDKELRKIEEKVSGKQLSLLRDIKRNSGEEKGEEEAKEIFYKRHEVFSQINASITQWQSAILVTTSSLRDQLISTNKTTSFIIFKRVSLWLGTTFLFFSLYFLISLILLQPFTASSCSPSSSCKGLHPSVSIGIAVLITAIATFATIIFLKPRIENQENCCSFQLT